LCIFAAKKEDIMEKLQNFPHFTWSELTYSATGSKLKIENVPNDSEVRNITDLVLSVLEPLRSIYGKPILVTSCFRCEKLNEAVGGAKTSQHMAKNGAAADIRTKCDVENALLAKLVRDRLEFDQLIYEYGTMEKPKWVHVSFNRGRNRRQVLYYDGKSYKPVK
jgi:hypothetical protein